MRNGAYITLDWDWLDVSEFAKGHVERLVHFVIVSKMRRLDDMWRVHIRDIWWRQSANGHVHVLVRVDNALDWHSRMVLRALLLDDPRRLRWDCLRVLGDMTTYSIGVLFDLKDGKMAGLWRKVRAKGVKG